MSSVKEKKEKKEKKQIPFTSFTIVRMELTRNGEPRIQIQEYGTWKLYEATFCIHRDNKTGDLTWGVVRHYSDPESQAWFPDSEPWPAVNYNEEDNNGD